MCVSFSSSVVNYSVTLVPDASGDSGDFFCVMAEELTYGKKIKDSLFPWYDLPVRLSHAGPCISSRPASSSDSHPLSMRVSL